MAFPWGGSLTHQQLATKFGWPTVIISAILLPILMLWSKLLAFPIWIPFKNGPFYMQKTTFFYSSNENVMMQKIYTGPSNLARFPAGWNCYADVEGKKFFEAFWGILQVLDLDATEDRFKLSSNWMTWLLVSIAFIDFPKPPVFENKVRIYFPLKGPNMINPFCWVTMAIGISGITWSGKYAFKPFYEKHGVTKIATKLPPDEEPQNVKSDGSFIYENVKKEPDYGSLS